MIPLSPLETKLLSLLLKHGASTAAELLQLSSGEVKRGTIYVTLHRMEEKNLLASSAGTYHPTVKGVDSRLKTKEWLGL